MIEEMHIGPDSVQAAVTLRDLGAVHGKLGDAVRRHELLKRAVSIYEKHFGTQDARARAVREELDDARKVLGADRGVDERETEEELSSRQ